jgi:hypothetical protein
VVIDLEVIRQRNEAWKRHNAECRIHGCDGEHAPELTRDIETLLAEVDRLSTKGPEGFCPPCTDLWDATLTVITDRALEIQDKYGFTDEIGGKGLSVMAALSIIDLNTDVLTNQNAHLAGLKRWWVYEPTGDDGRTVVRCGDCHELVATLSSRANTWVSDHPCPKCANIQTHIPGFTTGGTKV